MRHVVHKFWGIWEFENEEKWLNEMSAKGLQLVDVGYCKYVFDEGKPGEYLYRIELLEKMISHPESTSYIHFLEETGVEHVGSYLKWAYFRKKAADGQFDLFSDIDSRIKHCKRVNSLFVTILVLNLFAMFYNLLIGLLGISTANLGVAALSFIISIMLIFGIVNFSKKINEFKKERILRE